MRKLSSILYVSLAVALCCTGCKKWLDVHPENNLSDDKLFADANGFRIALNGVYQQASGYQLYGKPLSWGLASAMGQEYDRNTVDGDMYQVMGYNWDDDNVKGMFSGIWSAAYNTIANCNKIITEIEKADTMIFPLKGVERDLILGEAKALRGLLHFELVKLFAPAPMKNRTVNAIPYQLSYPSYVTAPSTVDVVMKNVIKDLEDAQQLVVRNDTITNRSAMSQKLQSLLSGSSQTQGGLFFNFRMHRMNYVAIQGLLARVYLYNGDRENALKKAEFLYKTYSPAGRLKWWAFTNESESKGENKYSKLVDDVILAFYDTRLIEYFVTTKASWYDFAVSRSEVNKYMPPTERDYRRNLIDEAKYTSAKWNENLSTWQWRKEQNSIIPVLRFSEIYYIYSETLFEAGRTNEALTVLNQIRNARGRTTTFSSTVPGDFYKELFDEFHREFLLEGQVIFQHKRLDRSLQVETQTIPMDNRFVLAIPDSETNF
ncbi:RagB/SusD family nutrient uptake outer membrane protein [Pseudobacter ginsenosidimutans]|uniref:SusD-like starch-binding protein associating with outer membrane n=1 Tax=Pseudobacter ginsenosidimutans TaxID=661488 RepID=A0A4Q7MUR2_9BACT|nr:RagB/SusD family nutrient uptake outer membrane protein [Pseudobacter ginsenosidimutans]QEC40639.1 RagB/SusD family nutrient uptake outer membrane protein [Pseudobacter ginsenosidimutans]RZS72642.1 SusD-like starch-binding protein associating with outer membrane [Pseudobacter ginsenosidimutans]